MQRDTIFKHNMSIFNAFVIKFNALRFYPNSTLNEMQTFIVWQSKQLK